MTIPCSSHALRLLSSRPEQQDLDHFRPISTHFVPLFDCKVPIDIQMKGDNLYTDAQLKPGRFAPLTRPIRTPRFPSCVDELRSLPVDKAHGSALRARTAIHPIASVKALQDDTGLDDFYSNRCASEAELAAENALHRLQCLLCVSCLPGRTSLTERKGLHDALDPFLAIGGLPPAFYRTSQTD
jgi:hypothetical protein